MAELINLNKARKAKIKQTRTAQAAQNRIVYGISTDVRKLSKLNQKRETEKIDRHLLNADDDHKKG